MLSWNTYQKKKYLFKKLKLLSIATTVLFSTASPAFAVEGDVGQNNVGASSFPWNEATPAVYVQYDDAFMKDSHSFSFTDDGRYIFSREGTSDPDHVLHVSKTDRTTGLTEYQIESSTGNYPDGKSDAFAVSGDGKILAFQSDASNLIGEGKDTNSASDIFLKDTTSFTTDDVIRISVNNKTEFDFRDNPEVTNYNELNGPSSQPVISGDGRKIAYVSSATNHLVGDTSIPNIYVYDRDNDQTTWITMGEGAQIPDGPSSNPFISKDGNTVAFTSEATNLVSGKTNNKKDIFIWSNYQIERITNFNGDSTNSVLSSNGQYIAFTSNATDIDGAGNGTTKDVFIYNRAEGTFTRVSNGAFSNSYPVSISNDGRYLSFNSDNGNPESKQAFVYDLESGETFSANDLLKDKGIENAAVSDILFSENNDSIAFKAKYNVQSGEFSYDNQIIFVATNHFNFPVWGESPQLTINKTSNNTVNLTWTPATASSNKEVIGYKIYVDRLFTKFVEGANNTSATLTDLDMYYSRYIQVEAVNSDYNETTNGPGAGTDGGVQLIKGTVTAKVTPLLKVELNWDPAYVDDSTTRYEVLRKDSAASNMAKVGEVTAGKTTYVDDMVSEGQTYTYFIKGFDENGKQIYESNFVEKKVSLVEDISYFVPKIIVADKEYVAIGSKISIKAKGVSGQSSIEANITTGNGEPTKVLLNESGNSGDFEGTFPIPEGIQQISSILMKFGGNTKELLQNPLYITGGLKLDPAVDFTEAKILNLRSEYQTETININGDSTKTITNIVPTNALSVEILDSAQSIIYFAKDVKVESGVITSHHVEGLKTPAKVKIELKKGSTPVTGSVFVTVNGNEIGTFYSDLNGIVNLDNDLIKGDEIVITFNNSGTLINAAMEKRTLVSGANLITMALEQVPLFNFSGRIIDENGKGIPNTSISAYSNASYFYETGISNKDGYYEIKNILKGEAEINITSPNSRFARFKGTEIFSADLIKDYVLAKSEIGLIYPEIRTKHIGGDWKDNPIDWRVAVHYRIRVEDSSGKNSYYGNQLPIEVNGKKGEVFTVCGDAAEAGIPGEVCTDVALDENNEAVATLNFVEKGAIVKAEVFNSDGTKLSYSNVQIFQELESGELKSIPKVYVNSGPVMNIQGVTNGAKLQAFFSSYDWITGKSVTRTVPFIYEEGSIINLGNITLEELGYFQGRQGNLVQSSLTSANPGTEIPVRISYKNHNSGPVTNAKVILDIPSGTELVPNSVIVNNVPQGNVDQSSKYEATIGEIPVGGSGVIRYYLKINSNYQGDFIQPSANITYDNANAAEIIGSVKISTVPVSIEAPNEITNVSQDLTLSGRGFADNEVAIYVDGNVLAKTKANGSGLWKLAVNLPNYEAKHIYSLFAESNGQKSAGVKVVYDPSKPTIKKLSFRQEDGRPVEIDPNLGVARFPYVFVPGMPTTFEVEFNKIDRVQNVVIYVGTQAIPAQLENGKYVAVTSFGTPGDIFVDYDVIPEVQPIERPTTGTLPTGEALKESLPEKMQSFEVKELKSIDLEKGVTKGSISIDMPNQGLNMKTDLSLVPKDYTPSADSKELGEKLGIYDPKVEIIETEDGNLITTVTGYVKLEDLELDGTQQGSLLASLNLRGLNLKVASVGAAAKFAAVQVKTAWTALGGSKESALNSLSHAVTGGDGAVNIDGGFGAIDKFGKIGGLSQLALQCNGSPETFKEIDNLNTQIFGAEVAKVAVGLGIMALSAVLVPATAGASLGLGTAIAGAVMGNGINGVIDSDIDNKLNRLEQKISGSGKCDKDKDKDKDNSDGSGTKVATPVWIYDPSGFVYEGLESNRIEGVTATAWFKNTSNEPWQIWDADWFGQINPQKTDGAGKYGWDVPPGIWQVVWEHPDYVKARSAELTVPPPHFDVNEGLVSFKAPTVSGVVAEKAPAGNPTTGDTITITFDKFIQTSELQESMVVLKAGDDSEIAGTVQALNAGVDRNGKELANKIVFTTTGDSGIVVGNSYSLTVLAGNVKSYAGVQMAADYSVGDLKFVDKDIVGPQLVKAVVEASGNNIRLEYDEKIDSVKGVKAENYSFTDSPIKVANALLTRSNDKQVILVLTGQFMAGQNVQVDGLEGAVFDENGNPSGTGAMTVTNSQLSNNASLTSLSLSKGSLSPSFSSGKYDYTVSVANAVEVVTVTASAADGATLQIDGTKADNGVGKTVPLVVGENTVQVYVRSQDGKASNLYTVKITRAVEEEPKGDDGNGGSSPGSGSSGAPSGGTKVDNVGGKEQVIDAKQILSSIKNGVAEVNVVGANSIVLPMDTAGVMKGNSMKVAVEGDLSINIPAEIISQLVEEASSLAGKDTSIYFTFNKVDSSKENAVANMERVNNANLKVGSDIYEFQIGARTGDGKETEIKTFTKPLTIAFKLKPGMNEDLTGVYFISDKGELEYIGGKIENGMLTADITHFSKYAAIEYSKEFSDLPINHWAYATIKGLAAKQLLKGTTADKYEPAKAVTRAEFTAILVRTLGLKNGKGTVAFTDIGVNDWYYEVVTTAVNAGLVKGTSATTFEPQKTITREEMAAMILRAYETKASGTPSASLGHVPFKDVDKVSSWAKDAVAQTSSLKLLNGYNNEFNPKGKTTRAEAAAVINNYLKIVK